MTSDTSTTVTGIACSRPTLRRSLLFDSGRLKIGFWVSCFRFRVSGFGFRVPASGVVSGGGVGSVLCGSSGFVFRIPDLKLLFRVREWCLGRRRRKRRKRFLGQLGFPMLGFRIWGSGSDFGGVASVGGVESDGSVRWLSWSGEMKSRRSKISGWLHTCEQDTT